MAQHGINAKLTVGGYSDGFKDISVDNSGNEVEVKARGQEYVRYLRGQKNFTITTSAEAGSSGAQACMSAYKSGNDVAVSLSDASSDYGSGSQIISAQMIVLSCTPTFPVDGEATYEIKLGLSAKSTTNPTIA